LTPLPEQAWTAIAGWRGEGPLVVGLCGAQGSGKSTLAGALHARAEAAGLKAAVLSLDDLYLPPEARPVGVHPLFATRGVPGTHDVALGLRTLDELRAGKSVALPRFDKANDRPAPVSDWPQIDGPVDLVLFEGWCVGARPQAMPALSDPVNALERDEDPDGVWRACVNQRLSTDYAGLWARIDRLILLAAPGFEVVKGWRAQQEDALRQKLRAEGREGAGLMDDQALTRFIAHYERLTRHILVDMPRYADLTVRLGPSRELL